MIAVAISDTFIFNRYILSSPTQPRKAMSTLGRAVIFVLLTLFIVISANASQTSNNMPVSAQHGMVSTAQHLATDVGVNILKQGGNAIDAAVAVGYALAVVEPCCGNIGGGGFMLIRFANGTSTFINFRETAPKASKTSLYLDKQGRPIPNAMSDSYLAVATPGTVKGLNYALAKYGTMTLPQVIKPAIQLAQHGYTFVPGDTTLLKQFTPEFNRQTNVAAIFTRKGNAYQAGDMLVQKNLAHTLSLIAKQGDKGFYEGEIAQNLVDASKAHGGVLTLQDLQQYRVEEDLPITCQYRDYQIISAPPPSSGGVTLCEILAITQAFPLTQLGYHTSMSSHNIIEVMRFAYQDRNQYLGDPDFVKNPIDKLLSQQHINDIVNKIKAYPNQAINVDSEQNSKAGNTTHYSIVDKYGNAVSVTYTLNNFFGNGMMAGNSGFFLNNEMDDFSLGANIPNEFQLKQGDANSIEPNKRPLSSMTPTIVLKDKQLFLVLGAPGGSTITTQVLEAIENVVDYGMNISAAIDAPRYHMQGSPNVVFMEPNAFTPSTLKALKSMGYAFQLGPPWTSPIPTWGEVAIVERDPKTGMLYGAIDKRRPAGSAKGY